MKNSLSTAQHYKWGDNCDGWHLVNTASLSIIQEIMPPGTAEKVHYHKLSQQVFYILKGLATFEIDDQIYEVKPGESIHILPLSKHCIRNKGREELHFLVVSEPKSHGDRIDL